jgi:polyhydroxybutyrate depolymerase
MRYVVHRPPGLGRDRVAPLVVVNTGANPNDLITMTGFNAEADKNGFLVAYMSIPHTYNDQSRGTNGSGEPYPDLQFIRQAVTQIRTTENADPSRIYLTGFSAGGVLAQRAACLLADQFAAVGPVGARLVLPECVPRRPVSMFVIYGTKDPTISTDIVRGDVAHWRQVDGCLAQAKTTSSGSVTVETWSPCLLDTVVALATIPGQDHAWPRGPEFDATSALWAFFAAHPRAASAPSGKLLSVRVVSSAKGRRVLVRINAGEALSVRLRLLNGRRAVATATFGVQPQALVLQLRVPARVRPGAYKLELVLRSVLTGGTRTIVRAIKLPSLVRS